MSPQRVAPLSSSSRKGSPVDNHNTPSKDLDDEYAPECGIGLFRPAALRRCANMRAFTGFYSVCSLLIMTLNSYVTSQVTTLERHFGFSSSETGLIVAANDIGFLVVVLFVSYVASKVHIPRALGGATIMFGVSGIICALPMFLFGAPSPVLNVTSGSGASAKSFAGQLCDPLLVGNDKPKGCDVKANTEGPSSDVSWTTMNGSFVSKAALGLIVLGMLLQGLAKAPRSAYVTVYVDGNVEKVKTGFYMGIITTFTIVGPALAFGLGGLFSRIHVTLQDSEMTPRHPRWIGAWWLGYLVFGCAAILFSLPLFLFPRWIKGRHPSEDEKQARQATDQTAKGSFLTLRLTKDFLASVKRLLVNPVYVCILASTCITMFATSGASFFGPKYIENIFSLPAWKANMTLGGLVLGSMCVGTLAGGWMTKRVKMGPMGALKFVLGVEVITLVTTIPALFLYCPQPVLFNSPGPRAAMDETSAGCFQHCACDDSDFLPVCGSDMRTYFSPCHAGCTKSSPSMYSNCTCIAGGQAVAGHCDYSCPMFIVHIVFVAVTVMVGASLIMPKMIIFIRSVEERDKSLAVGFNAFAMSITGWMLGPLVFGKIIDQICIQWQTTCHGRGACRLYDNDQLRLHMQGIQLAAKVVCVVLTALALLAARFRTTTARDTLQASQNSGTVELSTLVASAPRPQETR